MSNHNTSTPPLSSRQQIRRLTVTAMLTAVIWLMATTPYFGFTLPFFGVAMTFIHIPAIIGTLMEGLTVGTTLSTMFGLTSLYNAYANPVSIYSPMFQNPLISVLPRVLVGPTIYGAMLLARKLLPGKKKAQYTIAAIVGALANTAYVLSALTIANWINPAMAGVNSGITTVGIWGLAANSPIECASAVLVTLAVMTALRRIYD